MEATVPGTVNGGERCGEQSMKTAAVLQDVARHEGPVKTLPATIMGVDNSLLVEEIVFPGAIVHFHDCFSGS